MCFNWPCGQDAGRSPQAAESALGADEEMEPRRTAFDCRARLRRAPVWSDFAAGSTV
jgi:hypothetical protein